MSQLSFSNIQSDFYSSRYRIDKKIVYNYHYDIDNSRYFNNRSYLCFNRKV